jgi:hypothetical protein
MAKAGIVGVEHDNLRELRLEPAGSTRSGAPSLPLQPVRSQIRRIWPFRRLFKSNRFSNLQVQQVLERFSVFSVDHGQSFRHRSVEFMAKAGIVGVEHDNLRELRLEPAGSARSGAPSLPLQPVRSQIRRIWPFRRLFPISTQLLARKSHVRSLIPGSRCLWPGCRSPCALPRSSATSTSSADRPNIGPSSWHSSADARTFPTPTSSISSEPTPPLDGVVAPAPR